MAFGKVYGAAFAVICAVALAGCQATAVDPRLRTASAPALREHLQSTCQITQARLQNVTEARVSRGCSCYASRTLKAMDATEVNALRQTAVFNATAREKALKAIDACGLKRP